MKYLFFLVVFGFCLNQTAIFSKDKSNVDELKISHFTKIKESKISFEKLKIKYEKQLFKKQIIKDRKVISTITIFPNPVNNILNISFYSKLSGKCKLTVFNSLKNEQISEIKDIKVGDNKFSMKLNSLNKGYYILTFENLSWLEKIQVISFVKL